MKKNPEASYRPWSKLRAAEKREWLDEARKIVYPDLEPATPAKEARVPIKARELYDATMKPNRY